MLINVTEVPQALGSGEGGGGMGGRERNGFSEIH